MEDVLERALGLYRDSHPKQQGFAFLHCWTLLREVPRWWESPVDVQRKGHAAEGSPGAPSMAARRVTQPSQPAQEGDAQTSVDEKLMREHEAEVQRGKRPHNQAAVAAVTAAGPANAPAPPSEPASTVFGSPTSTPPTSTVQPPMSPEHSPMPEDGQGDSICIPDTQPQPQPPSTQPCFAGNRNVAYPHPLGLYSISSPSWVV